MISLLFYLLNHVFYLHLPLVVEWEKEPSKYYYIDLLWQHSGRCGLGGHVFSVYALYLSLINALLLSAVIHTSEQG